MFEASSFAELADASREFLVACNRDGEVLYADERAQRIIGARCGDSLRVRVAPGCEEKFDDFLRRSCTAHVDSCEIPFVVDGKPCATSLSSAPHGVDVLVVGCVIPAAFGAAMSQVSVMVSEAVDLNRALFAQRNEIRERHAELSRVNLELSESHQGILALHRELQAKSDETQHDNVVKTRLVAHLSHELRTPLHSILGLTQLLKSNTDPGLVAEQAQQVRFIRASAEELLTLVDDVLDLGRLDAGHAQVHIDRFGLDDFVGSMRGALRPLLPSDAMVNLVIEDAPTVVALETDRTKLSQIVRNLVSNALKFTERGEVRVRMAVHAERVEIRVSDTGIGIAQADIATIFEEYGQVESHLQTRTKGTGLGLPLSLRLAERLGGTLLVTSTIAEGSTFTVDIPITHAEARAMHEMRARSRTKPAGAVSVLVVEDDRQTLVLYDTYLVAAGFHVMAARSIDEAAALMSEIRPAAIVLDVLLEGDSSWGFLAALKNNPDTQDIPVLVVTVTHQEDKARALGADEFWLKPIDQGRLVRKLQECALTALPECVLVIDDDDTARYIIRRLLEDTPCQIVEATTGEEGIAIARARRPSVILLDFSLGACTAFDVIDALKADPLTRDIPVIVITSSVLDADDQRRLAAAVISKRDLTSDVALDRIRDALAKVSLSRA